MDKKDKIILKIKASMWESRNEERLLSKAIRAYQDPQNSYRKKGNVTVYVSGKKVCVTNVPLIEQDGQLYENLHLTATLEEILEEIFGDNPPNIVNFDDLLE